MAIRTSEVVFFAVARSGGVVALQENNPVNISGLGTAGVWARVSATTVAGAADVSSSFIVTGNNLAGTVQILPGAAALTTAFLVGDDVSLVVAIGGVTQSPITFHLRGISTIDFLLLQNGSHVPVAVNANVPAGYNPYAWAATPGALLGAAALTFTPAGPPNSQLLSITSPPSWNIDGGNFNLAINTTHATNPFLNSTSTFGAVAGLSTPTLALRALEKSPGVALGGYSYLRGHNNDAGTGAGINAVPPLPATITGAIAGGPGDWPNGVTFDNNGKLQTSPAEGGVTSWNVAPGTITVTVHDGNGVRPDAFVSGLAFKMRQLTADPPYKLQLPYDVAASARNLTILGGDAFTFSAASVVGGTSSFSTSVLPVPQLQWGQFALRAGDAASLHVTLDANAAGFPAESGTIPIAVATPAMATITIVPATLPTARQELRYQATLTASVTPSGTQQLEWYLEATESTDLEFGAPISTTSATNLLRTQSLHVIPLTWAAGNRNVHVHVVLRDGGTVLATTDAPAPANVTLPIAATLTNINSALMIDRSGSMAAEFRWPGAMSGAQHFAQLAKDRNNSIGRSHGVQAMWFGGWDDVPTPNYPSPQPPTDPLAAGNYGTLLGDRGAGVIIPLDFAHFATDAQFDQAFTDAPTRQTPFFWTAIGSGILAAKDALLAADPGHTKERVIFLFTDGMENRAPMVDEATQAAGTYWFHPDPALGLPNNVDPQTRIYACALGTAQSFADGLKPACNNTGGIGELDVKFIPSGQVDANAVSLLVQNWFNSSFAMMFGYTSLTSPDPELAGGATASHVVQVTEGHSQLIVSVFVAAPPSTDWTLDVQPPGGSTVITEAEVLAGALGTGVRFYSGPMHKSFVIDLPLAIPGESQRWAGDWTSHVTRTATTTGDYLFSAMAKQDITYQVALEAPAPTRVGNRVTVRAYLAQEKSLISDAHVIAHVSSPGKWLDDPIARQAGRTHFVAAVPKKGDPASDLTNVQAATRSVLGEIHVHRRTFDVPLLPTTPGFYEGSFIVDEPGTWEVRTSADGRRGGPRDWAKWDQTFGEMIAVLTPRAYEDERARLSKEGAQPYHLEDDQTFGVIFVPDVHRSTAGGMARPNLLELFVVPQDGRETLLGVGRAKDIVFHTDCGLTFPSQDAGQGTYFARIPLHGKNIRIVRGVVLGEQLSLGDPRHPIPICNGRLCLSQFRVRVLGVDMPLQVRSPIGKFTRADLELAFPTFGASLAATSTAFAQLAKDDLTKHAGAAKGLPTFVAALRRALDVDFARTAEAVAARRYGIEVARQAACTFCRENGHESALGRFAGQLEATLGTLLEQWTVAHLDSAAHCRDGFFADADAVRHVVRELLAAIGKQKKA